MDDGKQVLLNPRRSAPFGEEQEAHLLRVSASIGADVEQGIGIHGLCDIQGADTEEIRIRKAWAMMDKEMFFEKLEIYLDADRRANIPREFLEEHAPTLEECMEAYNAQGV